MVLLPHCPGGCSRGSPLCLQSSCPAHWDGALVSEVSGSYFWWISSRSGQCGSPGVTLCRIRVGTCRLRLRLPSFSCVLDMEASANGPDKMSMRFMNLILILSGPFSVQEKEPYLCEALTLACVHFQTSFFQRPIKLYNLVSVWVTLTFIQGQSSEKSRTFAPIWEH